MSLENKYGKSAVDATRRNALPPWLDTVLGTSGAFLPISGGTLTGELRAPNLLMLKEDSSNEGGQIALQPATSSWPTTYLDSYRQYFRVHDGSIEILKLDLQSDNKSLVIPRGSVWAGEGSLPSVEVQCGVRSAAGQLFLYAAASSTGNRGLWVPAHGTGSGYNLITIDTNNEPTFLSWGSGGGYFTRDKSLTINTVPSSNRYGLGYNMQDSTGNSFAYVRGLYLTDNMLGMQIETRRQVNGSWVYNTINFGIYSDGTRYVTLNAAAQWKAAIGLNKVVNQTTSFSLSGTTLTITNS